MTRALSRHCIAFAVSFALDFVDEGGQWKLLQINVKVE